MAGDIKEGRPLKFKTLKELEDKIQAYFDSCFITKWVDEEVRDELGNKVYIPAEIGQGVVLKIQHVKVKEQVEPATITGLAYALDTTRQTLLTYAEKDEFTDTITRAKQFIESLTEKGLMSGKIPTNGAIFNLKNNWGWKDEIHNVNRDGNLTPEQKAKMDELLLTKKPNEGNQPGGTKTS